MKTLTLALLICGQVVAADSRVKFDVSKSAPFAVSVVLSPECSVVSHEKSDGGDTVTVAQSGIDEPTHGLFVEVTDAASHVAWTHDFGFDVSSLPGYSVRVECYPKLPLILVHSEGYKSNHDHKLLFFEISSGKLKVQEYLAADQDILPSLQKQREFPSGYRYWIYPEAFTDKGLSFACIPLQKPGMGGHPFAQDQTWFDVIAAIDANQRVIVSEVKASPH